MSQHWLYINSSGYRSFVELTKQKPWILWGALGVVAGVGALASKVAMELTNPNMEEEGYKHNEAEFKKLPLHAQVRLGHGP